VHFRPGDQVTKGLQHFKEPGQKLIFDPITGPFNATGHPGLALPCGFGASGLPLGLQLIGRSYGEATLLRIAQAYEDVAGWLARRPDLEG